MPRLLLLVTGCSPAPALKRPKPLAGATAVRPPASQRRTCDHAVMVDISSAITIDCPVDVVANYAADPSNAPEWYVNIRKVTWETTPPLNVGSRVAFVAQFLGRTLAYTYEIVDLVPGERLVMRTAQGPFPMETTYLWSPRGTGATEMTLRNRGEPSGFSRLAAPLMSAGIRRANRKDLQRLKSILESGDRP